MGKIRVRKSWLDGAGEVFQKRKDENCKEQMNKSVREHGGNKNDL